MSLYPETPSQVSLSASALPQDKYLALAMIILMNYLSWTWIGIVTTDDEKGIELLSEKRKDMQISRVCLAFVNLIPEPTFIQFYNRNILSLSNCDVNSIIVIIYGYHILVSPLTLIPSKFEPPNFEKFRHIESLGHPLKVIFYH